MKRAYNEQYIRKLVSTVVDELYPDCVGALLTGSAATNTLNDKSDLDLLVFYHEPTNLYYRKIINRLDWDVETVVYSIPTINALIDLEVKSRSNPLMDMTAKGVVIKDRDGTVNALKHRSLALLHQGPSPLTIEETNYYRYVITNRLNDLEASDNVAINVFIVHELLSKFLPFLLYSNLIWLSNGKRMHAQLSKLQAREHDYLLTVLQRFYQAGEKQPLIDYIEDKLILAGGRLTVGYSSGSFTRT